MREKLLILFRKKSLKNGLWMYLLQIFNTVVPLFTLPYITRILGSSGYGIFSIALNLIGYFQVFVEYGFGMSATRKVVLNEDDYQYINRTFSCVFFSRVIFLLICMIIIILYYVFFRIDFQQMVCLSILVVGLIGSTVQQNWLFQGKQEMKFISFVSMISRTVSVILIFMFVKKASDLYLYCLLYSVSPFLNGIIGFILAQFKFGVKIIKVQLSDIADEIKQGWYVFTTQLSSKIFSSIGITILAMYASSAEVGIFSAIQKIPNILMLAWVPIGQVLYPISSQRLKNGFDYGVNFIYKCRKIILPIFIVIALFVMILSKPIVYIAFGEEYVEYHYLIYPLITWLLFAINNNFLGIQILLGSGYDREYSICFQISVLCTVLLNLVLIYLFKALGAAIAPLLSELMLYACLKTQIYFVTTKSVKS